MVSVRMELQDIPVYPPNPIFNLTTLYNNDKHPERLNLGVFEHGFL